MRLLSMVLVGGCWTGTVPPPADPPVVRHRAPPPRPYATVAGTWRGIGQAYDTDEPVVIVMRLATTAPVGERIGVIAYPSLGCGGELIREREDRSGAFVVIEHLTENPEYRCSDGGTIRFTRRGRELDWHWYEIDGNERTTALLARVR
jgi:hypothetical protein